MASVISLFNDCERDVGVRLTELQHLLVLRCLVSSFRCGQRFELDDYGQVTRVTFTDISIEISAKKARTTLGQVGLGTLDLGPHPFSVVNNA